MTFSRFFSSIQETDWYYQFLYPVVQEVNKNSKVLDIGTGSGKLLQLLWHEYQLKGIGLDTSPSMLKEAKKKLSSTPAQVYLIKANEKIPFEADSFDRITICSVLFILSHNAVDFLLEEALRVLKKEGKIVVLTPTGKGSFMKLSKRYFSLGNASIYLWFSATRKSAGRWLEEKHLARFSTEHKLNYSQKIVFRGFAQIEILTRE